MHPQVPSLALAGDPVRNLLINTLRALVDKAVRIVELNDTGVGDDLTALPAVRADGAEAVATWVDEVDGPADVGTRDGGASALGTGAGAGARLRRAAELFAQLAEELQGDADSGSGSDTDTDTDTGVGAGLAGADSGQGQRSARRVRERISPLLSIVRRSALDAAETAFWHEVARLDRDLQYVDTVESGGIAALNGLLAESLAKLRTLAIEPSESKIVAARLNDILRRAIYLFAHLVDTVEVDLACSAAMFERDVEHFIGKDRANRQELFELWQGAGAIRPPPRGASGHLPVGGAADGPTAAADSPHAPGDDAPAVLTEAGTGARVNAAAAAAASAAGDADSARRSAADGIERIRIRLPLPYLFSADTEQGRRRARRESWEDLVFVPHRSVQRQDVLDASAAAAAKFTVVLPPLALIRTAFDYELGLSRVSMLLAREVTRVTLTRGGGYLPARSAKLADRPASGRPDPLTHYLLFRDFGDIGHNPRLARALGIPALAEKSLFEPSYATGLCDVFDDEAGQQWLECGFGYLALLGRGHPTPTLLRFDGVAIEYAGGEVESARHSPLQQALYRAALDPQDPLRAQSTSFTGDEIIRQLMQVPVAQRRFG